MLFRSSKTLVKRTTPRVLCALLFLAGCYDAETVADVTPLGQDTELETQSDTSEDPWWDIDCGDRVWDYSITLEDLMDGKHDYSEITHIRGSIHLSDTEGEYTDVSDFSQLRNVRCVDRSLDISYLPQLRNLDDFSELKKISGDLYIMHNTSLDDMSAFEGVDFFGGKDLAIMGNSNLSTCAAMDFKKRFYFYDPERSTCITRNLPEPDCPEDNSDCNDL